MVARCMQLARASVPLFNVSKDSQRYIHHPKIKESK